MDFFRLATPRDKKYVLIIADNGQCYSHYGMIPVGINKMSLAPSCVSNHATVLHEFLHAFGVFHTHQRPDRDDFITVHWDNIKPFAKTWYNKYQNSELDETISGIPYDVLSLMHYTGYGGYTIDKTKPSVSSKVGIFNSGFSGLGWVLKFLDF